MHTEVLEGIVAWERDPGPIIQRLRERLAEYLAEARQAAEEVTRGRQEIAARQAEQDRVITLYRKGRITASSWTRSSTR
jgi:vacuolar-type H+-ATPase subunit H